MTVSNKWMTAKEVADMLGVSAAMAWKWARRGELVVIRLTQRTTRFDAEDVLAFARKRAAGGAGDFSPPLVTAETVAKHLNVPVAIVWRLAREGKLPHFRLTPYCIRFPFPPFDTPEKIKG